MTNLGSIVKKQRHHFADKGPYSQSYVLFSSHTRMWELDHKEGWDPKIDAFKLWCWRRFLRVLCTSRRSNQSILKEINPEYSLERLMLKLLIICASDVKRSLIGKDLDAGKDWRQKKKGVAEDEMDIWHYQLSGHEFEQTLGDSEGLRSLACCRTMGLKNQTWLSNWTLTTKIRKFFFST